MGITRTAQQILDDVQLRYPNSVAESNRVEWLNIVLWDTYKTIGRDRIGETLTVEDQPFYFLTDTANGIEKIDYSQITSIVVNGIEYQPRNKNEGADLYTYFKVDKDIFGLNPTPQKSNQQILVFYKERPSEIIAGTLDVVPEINEDYYEVVKYGLMVKIAEAEQDIQSRNNFADEFINRLNTADNEENAEVRFFTPTDLLPKRSTYGSGYSSPTEVISSYV